MWIGGGIATDPGSADSGSAGQHGGLVVRGDVDDGRMLFPWLPVHLHRSAALRQADLQRARGHRSHVNIKSC